VLKPPKAAGPAPPQEVLTIEEVAGWLGRNAHALRQRAHEGELPGRKVGRGWRFGREAIAELLAAGEGRGVGTRRRRPPAPGTSGGEELGAVEAAAFLRVPPQTLYAQVRKGRVQGWQERGRWRFSKQELLEWLRGEGERAGPEAPAG